MYSIGIDDGPDRRADLMDDILNGGATTERTRPPLPAGQHLYYDEAVYELTSEVESERPATSFSVKVDIVQEEVDESEAIRFDDLPEVDQEKFAAVGLADGSTVGVGTSFLYPDDQLDESVLVPDSEYSYITWEHGAEAKWEVDRGFERTLRTYQYTAEKIGSAAEYGRRMRERFGFELTGLSEAERDIVETAIAAEGYTVESDRTPTPAFQTLADRFQDAEPARALDEEDEGRSNRYLVEYEEAVYWTRLMVNTPSDERG